MINCKFQENDFIYWNYIGQKMWEEINYKISMFS